MAFFPRNSDVAAQETRSPNIDMQTKDLVPRINDFGEVRYRAELPDDSGESTYQAELPDDSGETPYRAELRTIREIYIRKIVPMTPERH